MSVVQSRARVEIEAQASREEIYDLNDRVQSLFVSGMDEQEGHEAWEHLLEERGLSEEGVRREGIGYVPDRADVVRDFAVAEGVSLETMADAGLLYRGSHRARKAFRRQNGRYPETDEELTEFFRRECLEDPSYYMDYPFCHTASGEFKAGRWMTLPIRDLDDQGQVRIAGFQFRSMRPSEEIGKRGRYMSPLNSPTVSWSEILIGLAEDRERIEGSGRAIFCEGKFDQLAIKDALRRSGVPEDRMPGVVALGGAKIRGVEDDEKGGVLSRLNARHVFLFMDGDRAGVEAAMNIGPALWHLGSVVSVVRVEDGIVTDRDPGEAPDEVLPKDPGDLLRSQGPQGVVRAIKEGRTRGIATFASQEMEARLGQDPLSGQLRRRLEALDHMVPVLRALSDDVRDKAIERASRSIGLDPAIISIAVTPEADSGPTREAEGRALEGPFMTA